MDLADILDRFAEAEHRVADGIQAIALQRAFVAKSKQEGRDATQAEDALGRLEQVHRLHIEDRDRALVTLREEIARL
jgi:hypothetical protein